MKRKLISLCLLSCASVLAISGCSTASLAKTNDPTIIYVNGDHPDLPHYNADELPKDDEVYDLTKELTYKDIKPATKEEFEEFLLSVAGPGLVGMMKETFSSLYEYVVKYNVLTARELYNIAGIVEQVVGVAEGKEIDLANLVYDLATKIDLDKVYYLLHKIREDKNAYAEVRQFVISMSNSTLIPLNYRVANDYLKSKDPNDTSLEKEAKDESYVWDNFKVCGEDYEFFETISAFFNDPDVRVLLRFINLVTRTMVKYLTNHELGFIFTQFGLIQDEEYADICQRYMINNASSFVNHAGKIIQGLNITDNSWMMVFRGAHTLGFTVGDDDAPDSESYIAVDNLKAKAIQNNIDFVYNAIDPHGFKVLLKFLGNFLVSLPRDLINSVMINMESPEEINVEAFTNIYSEQYAALSANDKTALTEQLDLMGIDISAFNFEIVDFDPGEENPFSFLMKVLETNLVEPFLGFFTEGLKIDPIYDDFDGMMEQPSFRVGDVKLILRQGEEFTEEDIIEKYLKNKESINIEFYVKKNAYSSSWFYDHDYRSNYVIVGGVDTSKVGEGAFLAQYHVDLPVDVWTDDSHSAHEIRHFEYDVEWKIYYYVIDSSIDVFASGFSNELITNRSTYDKEVDAAKDSHGNVAIRDHRNVINVKQNTSFVPNELFMYSDSYDIHVYDESEKRFVCITDEDTYKEVRTYVDLSTLDTSEPGLHYGYIEVPYQVEAVDYCIVKMVYAYNVVEGINYEVGDSFYDPGFGW